MANKLKSRRHKKRRLSSKKRYNKRRVTKFGRRTQKVGGMKRLATSSTNEPPRAPKKTRRLPPDGIENENPNLGVPQTNLFGFGGLQNQPQHQPQPLQANNLFALNAAVTAPTVVQQPEVNNYLGTPPVTQTALRQMPPTLVRGEVNNLFQRPNSPMGNLDDAMQVAYTESITTPPRNNRRPTDMTINPFGFRDDGSEIVDGDEDALY